MTEATAVGPKDAGILRSFARRIDAADPGAQNNLGVLYFRRGLHDEAIAAFSRALALDERMRVARRNLEIAYGEAGVLESRAIELEQRLAASPDDIGALVESGIAEKCAGNLDRAEKHFRRALEYDPDSSVLHFFLAEIFYNRGSGEESLRLLRRSIDLNPANPDAHYLAGFILGDLGRVDEAREANRRAVSLNPRLSRAEANLALDTPDGGEWPPEKTPTEIGASLPTGRPHLTLALALRLKGYHAEAMRECRAALGAGEDPPEALEAIGSLHLLLGQPGDALDAYDKRISLGGAPPRVLSQRGIALYLLGRRSEAEQTFRDCIVRTSYAAAENNLGALLWDAGKVREATNHFRRAARDDKSLDSARINLALALYRQGHFQLALDAYRAVLHDQPEHPVAWCGVARALLEFGRFAEARDACVRAIQTDASIAQAHAILGLALSALGDVDGAARATELAHKLDPHALRQPMKLEMDAPESSALIPGGGIVATALPDYTLGRDYLSKGLPDRAMGEIRRAMARGADETEGLVLLAKCFAARGEYDVAEKELLALGSLPQDDHVALEVASVHRALGQPREALRRVVDLLRSNVYHLGALVVLGESLLDLKRTRDAARAFARVLKFDPEHAVARKYSQIARLENA
jgi:tetratricopeptide (TPR) repeat protein